MRIIFLNTWNGETGQPLLDFIKEHNSDTDIFCFSEVESPLFTKISKILSDFKSDRAEKVYIDSVFFRVATFWKNDIKIIGISEMFIKEGEPGMGFGSAFEFGDKKLLVCNIHGQVDPGSKVDSPERIKQSEIIIEYAKNKKGPVIIGGDFNLMPDTKSIKMFEEDGFKNLIKEFDIKNTRNKLSWEQFNNVQYFADYCFVSPDIKVKNFEVPQLEISDHEPLILDFELASTGS